MAGWIWISVLMPFWFYDVLAPRSVIPMWEVLHAFWCPISHTVYENRPIIHCVRGHINRFLPRQRAERWLDKHLLCLPHSTIPSTNPPNIIPEICTPWGRFTGSDIAIILWQADYVRGRYGWMLELVEGNVVWITALLPTICKHGNTKWRC